MVKTGVGNLSLSPRNLFFNWFVLPAEQQSAVMAKIVGEMLYPGPYVFVKKFSRVRAHVHPINAASDQSVLVRMDRLEDFEEVVWGENALGENGGLFIFGYRQSKSWCFDRSVL